MTIRIGCSGWLYPEWKGLFYPEDLSQKEWFSFYAQHFNSVEVNNTFYHFPTLKTMNKWSAQAPTGFSYALKANRLITHIQRFKDVEDSLHRFYELGSVLKEKVGIFLFQLPPSFTYNPTRLQAILDNLDNRYHNVVEFRHPSWWNTQVYETFLAHNIIFCSVSAPGLPDEVLNFNDNIYLRLHGIPLYKGSYGDKELSLLATKIRQTKAKNIWVYFNNTMYGEAPMNALALKEMVA